MTAENKKVAEFQGLRGYAILLIALSHCAFNVGWFSRSGALGVMLSILLSGHLEMAKHGREGIPNVKKFVWSKVCRFYPLYLVTLFFSILVYSSDLRAAKMSTNIKVLALNMLQLQSWVPRPGAYFSYNQVSWYLSLTLSLAVMTPLMLWLVRHAAQSNKTLLLLAGITGFEFLWGWRMQQFHAAKWLIYICPLVRLLDFIAGGGTCVLARKLADHLHDSRWADGFLVVSLAACTALLLWPYESNGFLFAAVWSAPCICLVTALAAGAGKARLCRWLFANPVIVWIGDHSFEIFLIHKLVIDYCTTTWRTLGFPNRNWVSLAALAFSALAAYLWKKLAARIAAYGRSLT